MSFSVVFGGDLLRRRFVPVLGLSRWRAAFGPSFLLVEILKSDVSLGADVWVYDQWGVRVATGIDKAYMVVPAEKLWVYAYKNEEKKVFETYKDIAVEKKES